MAKITTLHEPDSMAPDAATSSDEDSFSSTGGQPGPGQEFESDEFSASEPEDAPEAAEPDYHTEPSSDEDAEDINHSAQVAAPYLPPHLLTSRPDPTQSVQQAIAPHDQLTRKQKAGQRNRSRQAKKRVWDRLRREAKGSGVLEAGRAAQIKRGVAPSTKNRVKSGRVEKVRKREVQASGRQQLLEQRKRAVRQMGSEDKRPAKRAKMMKSKR